MWLCLSTPCLVFFGWQHSPKLGRNFYLCCAAEKQGERIRGMPQGVQEHCGRAGKETWSPQVLDYSNVTKSCSCELPSWFVSFHAAFQSHLDRGMRTHFRYEHFLWLWLGPERKCSASMSNCSQHLQLLLVSMLEKKMSQGWLVLPFIKLYNPHWTRCLSSLG